MLMMMHRESPSLFFSLFSSTPLLKSFHFHLYMAACMCMDFVCHTVLAVCIFSQNEKADPCIGVVEGETCGYGFLLET